MRGISISFPGVKALDGVDFRLLPGEVHALMGENGAGKSTLIKALTGVYRIDSGTVVVRGRPEVFSGPDQAQAAGIATVYQEVNLCGNLTVAENILLGREPRRFGRIDRRAVRRRATELLTRLNLDLDPDSVLDSHPLAVQQLVAIARAVDLDAAVLILDEPTSSLDADEVRELFRIIRGLRAEGVAVLFVSHFLEQVYEIADRTTILRNGKLVGEYLIKDLPRLEMVKKMVGHELAALEDLEREPHAEAAERVNAVPVLVATGLGRAGGIAPTDVSVHAGEVVGLAGLLGSGRTELARLLFGADRADSGTVTVDGRPVKLRTPLAAIADRIAFSSEDRKAEGIVDDLTVRDNIVLALQARRGWRRLNRRTADDLVHKWITALDIRPANPNALIRDLSGGNQQKCLLARWLLTEPRLLILDEPTRGIDIGAKTQIQKLVAELADSGLAVVYISTELEEVLRLSDRLVVLRDRYKIAELARSEASMGRIMELIASGGGTHRAA
jgi:monosaccharide-transporting ATPase